LAADLLCEKGAATGAGARPRRRTYFHKDNIEAPVESAGLDRGTDEGSTPWLKYDVPADALKASPRWGGDGDAPVSWSKYGVRTATPVVATAVAQAAAETAVERPDLPEKQAAEAVSGADVPPVAQLERSVAIEMTVPPVEPADSELPEAALISQPEEMLAVGEAAPPSDDESTPDLTASTPDSLAEASSVETAPAVVSAAPDAEIPASVLFGLLADVDPDPILSVHLEVQVEPVRAETAGNSEGGAAETDASDALVAQAADEPEPTTAVSEVSVDEDHLLPTESAPEVERIPEASARLPEESRADAEPIPAPPAPESAESTAAAPEISQEAQPGPVWPPHHIGDATPVSAEPESDLEATSAAATLVSAPSALEAVDIGPEMLVPEAPADEESESVLCSHRAVDAGPIADGPLHILEESPVEEEPSLAQIAPEADALALEVAAPEARSDVEEDPALVFYDALEIAPISEAPTNRPAEIPVAEKLSSAQFAQEQVELSSETAVPAPQADAETDLVLPPQDAVEAASIPEEPASHLEVSSVEEEPSFGLSAPETVELVPEVPEAQADAEADFVLPSQDDSEVLSMTEARASHLDESSGEEQPSSVLSISEMAQLVPDVPQAQAGVADVEVDPVLASQDNVEVVSMPEESARHVEESSVAEEPSATLFAPDAADPAQDTDVCEADAVAEMDLVQPPQDLVEVASIPEEPARHFEESSVAEEPSSTLFAPDAADPAQDTDLCEADAVAEVDLVQPPQHLVSVASIPEDPAKDLEESSLEEEPFYQSSGPEAVDSAPATLVTDALADADADLPLPPQENLEGELPLELTPPPVVVLPVQPSIPTPTLARTWIARLMAMAPAVRKVAAQAVLAALEAKGKPALEPLANTGALHSEFDKDTVPSTSPSMAIETLAPIEPTAASVPDPTAVELLPVFSNEHPEVSDVAAVDVVALDDPTELEDDVTTAEPSPLVSEAEWSAATDEPGIPVETAPEAPSLPAVTGEPPVTEDVVEFQPEPSQITADVADALPDTAPIEFAEDVDAEVAGSESAGVADAPEAALDTQVDEPAEAPPQPVAISWAQSEEPAETVAIAPEADAAPIESEAQPMTADELRVEAAALDFETLDVDISEELTIEPPGFSLANPDVLPEDSIPPAIDAAPLPASAEPAAPFATERALEPPAGPPAELAVGATDDDHVLDERAARTALAAELTVVIGDILSTTKYATAITLKSQKSSDARETLALTPEDAEDAEADSDIDLAIEEALPVLVAARFGRSWSERALVLTSAAMLLAVGFFSYFLWFADGGVVSEPPAVASTSPPTAGGSSMATQGIGEADTQGRAALRTGAQKPARPGLMNARSTR